MISIRFKITEDIDMLESSTIKEIEDELYNVLGIFELRIHSNVIGIYLEDWPEELMGTELLCLWFNQLLDVLLRHEVYGQNKLIAYVHPNWIGFVFHDGKVNISKNKMNMSQGQLPLILEMEAKPCDIIWKELDIPYIELKKTVLTSSKSFLQELEKINPIILESKVAKPILGKLECIEHFHK